MNQYLEEFIHRVYIDRDYEFFKKKCQSQIIYLEKLKAQTESLCNSIDLCNIENEPSVTIWFKFDRIINDNFLVEFDTVLEISKVANVFYIQHEFSVDNNINNRMSPNLDGYSGQAYTKEQYYLEKFLISFLTEKGLQKLTYKELTEVYGGFQLEKDSLFGNQLTVENALFRDPKGILNQ